MADESHVEQRGEPIPPWTSAVAYVSDKQAWVGMIRGPASTPTLFSPLYATPEGAQAAADQALAVIRDRYASLGYVMVTEPEDNP